MNNKEALRGKLRGKMYANLCWTYVCLGYIGHFSKSTLTAECDSHGLLNRWSDCITCWVTVRASGVRGHLLSKMTIDSLSKLQLNLKMGLGTESTYAKQIPSLTLDEESRRKPVLKIEHFQIRGLAFSYHLHSGILFYLWVVSFYCMFLHSEYNPSKLFTRHFIFHVFIHSFYKYLLRIYYVWGTI